MRSSERLHNLLIEIEKAKKESLIVFWKKYFDVNDIFEVYEKLIYVKKEIDLFESELKDLNLNENKQFIKTLNTLNTIVSFQCLTNNVENQSFMKVENINTIYSSFEIFKTFADAKHIDTTIEENISQEELDEFKELLQKTILDLENSDLEKEDKKFLLEVFKDFDNALSLYKINGLESFIDAIRKNLCKLKLIEEAKLDERYNKYRNHLKKIAGTVFNWSIKYIKNKTIGLIESKAVKFIEEHAEEWSEIPLKENSEDNQSTEETNNQDSD